MADGHIKIDTRLDNSTIPSDLKKLQKMVESGMGDVTDEVAQKVSELGNAFSKLEVQQEKNNQKMQEYKDAISTIDGSGLKTEEMRAHIADMQSWLAELKQQRSEGLIDEGKFVNDSMIAEKTIKQIKAELQSMNDEAGKAGDIDTLKNKLSQAEVEAEKIALGMNKIGLNAKKVNEQLDGSNTKAKELDGNMKKTASSTTKVSTGVENVHKGLNKGLKKLLKYAVALIGVRSIYMGLRRAVSAWMNATQEGAQAQAELNAMFVQVGSIFAPLIQWLIGALRTVLAYVNAIAKAFFGVDLFSRSVKKNLSGAVGQAKELNKQLSGFDEMNVLGSNGQQNISGGVGAIDVHEIPEPDLSKFKDAIDKITQWIKGLWVESGVQTYFDKIANIAKMKFDSMVAIGSNIWNNILLTWELNQPNIHEALSNLGLYWDKVLTDMELSATEWLPKITEDFNQLVDDIFETMNPLTEFVTGVWKDLTQIMNDLWDEYGAPIVDSVSESIDKIVQIFNKIWTEIIDPILTPAIEMMSELWNNHLKDMVLEIGKFIGTLVSGALEIYNKVIAPIVMWLLEKLSPAFQWLSEKVFKNMGDKFGEVADRISGVVSALRRTFQGLIDFIVGIFTGDWERAWKGVKDIFGGIFDGLKELFKTPINWVIDKLNSFLRGLNKIEIPWWIPVVGGKSFNIPTLPRLARGTYTTGATTAVIGESGREAVVPLQNNTEWADDFLKVLDSHGGMGSGSITNIINLDGKEIARYTKDISKDEQFRKNGGMSYGY